MNGSPAGARRRPPWGLLAAAAAGIVLEVFVFSRAYLLADQTNLCLLYKKSLLRESRASDDVVIFGDSMPMLLDAAQMERWAGKRYTIRNEAVPELGPSLAYWLELEQYLDYHERPRLILFSTWPHAFYRRGEEVLSRMPDDFFIHRMRRYLDMRYLLREAAFEENAFLRAKNSLEILRVYSENLLPSVNYRIFIRACAPEAIAGTPVEQAADPGVQRHADPRETLRISRELMDRIRETKGQAGFGKNIVSRPDLFRYLPGLEAR
ncbi:MAG TPA: hypothetical protein VL404_06420, partial [Candidatus Eisenbacteria bacterium]|nr:hypothetical protein [Candidatus Eisenbacteria bacterium]